MGRRAAVFGDYCATEGHLKGPSCGPPKNGMKPKFVPAQPECLERGALVTYAQEVIVGLRPASGSVTDNFR